MPEISRFFGIIVSMNFNEEFNSSYKNNPFGVKNGKNNKYTL